MSKLTCGHCGGTHFDDECDFNVRALELHRRVEALEKRIVQPIKPVVSGLPTAEEMFEVYCRSKHPLARESFDDLHSYIASRVVDQKPSDALDAEVSGK
jgi:hypothetical protein